MTITPYSYGPNFVTSATVTVAGGSGIPLTYVLNRAAGVAVTLPAATGTGQAYRFVMAATATGDHTISCAGTDEFAGVIYQCDTDTSDADVAYPAIAADNFDTITLDGTTTGGLIGDWIEVMDVASGVWALNGVVNANGTVATPLSSS